MTDDTSPKSKPTEFFKPVTPRFKSEAEIQREKNIKERDEFLKSFMNEPDFAEAIDAIGIFNNKENTTTKPSFKPKIRRSNGDTGFTYFGNITIPVETRRSLRLLDKEPIYTKDDLVDETTFKRKKYDDMDDYDYRDLEDIVYRPKKIRIFNKKKYTQRPPIIPVEEVTAAMINKIAMRVSIKQYSALGSSCHQCRQKTLDQKTCCRKIECVGIRGQFCGVCLFNRYGENAAEALKDPNWHCPVCRGICNCSFCRAKEGKRPTGILTPMAHQNGHKSVKDFLESLSGKGDYIEEEDDPDNLLGFTNDLKKAQMGGGVLHNFECQLDLLTLQKLCEELENRYSFR